jgi:hypothetical protein
MADELDFSGALDRVLQQQATGAPTVSPATPATPLAPTTNLLTGAAPTPSPFAAALDQVLRGDTAPPPAATAPDMTEATPAPALPPSNDAQVVQEAASGVAAANGLLAEGVRPEVVAEIRRISRDQGIPLPLAAQTYIERAQAAPGARYRQLLQRNPGLRRIATQGAAYADFMTDADELATTEQAFTEAKKEWSVGAVVDSVEQLGNILEDTLVGRAITRGTLQTIAALPTLGASLELGVALDIGATEEQILERIAAPYGGWAAMENYPASMRMSVLAAARQQYNLVQGLTEDDRAAALQRAGEYFFSAGELVAQAEGLVRNPGSQRFITNTLSQAPNTVAGTLEAFASDPVNGGLFLAETILESAPNIAATVIVSRVTGSLSLGAAVGATTGGGREYVLSTTQFLAERGYTINSVEDAIAILQNAELMQEAADFGFARAIPIAILDGLAGVASGVRLGSTVLGDVAAQTAMQAAAGGTGEALAQRGSEGEITSLRDITIEALAELPTALIEVPLAAGRSFGSERLPLELNQLLAPGALQSAADQAAAAQQALETARAAIEETATFARDPDAVRELLVAAGDQEVSIPVQEIERLYQEGALTDDDIAYLNVEDELTQQGELSGDVVTTASRVLTLQGDAFARLSEHVRTQAGAPTVAEAREALANREADITRLQATLEQAQNVAGEINTLADTITDQLRATTGLSRGQARAAGRLMAERYAARAALFEPGTTAQSLYDRDRVTFEGERAASAPLLEQPAVEVVQPGIDGTYRVTEGQVRAELNVAPNEPYASSVQVPGGMQRQGIATALYDAAERDLGRRMFPSPLGLTSDAQQFWIDRLSRIPQAEALALLDEAQVSGDARNVGRSTAERLAPIRESVLSRDPDQARSVFEQAAADIGRGRERLAQDPTSLGLDPELAASINPIYRPEALPPGRMKGSNQEAAQFLEDTYADEPITDLTAEITPERLDRIATQMAAETELALESSGNAADWYSAALERTLSVAAVKYPMLTSDAAADAAGLGTASNARFLFTYIMATTSQNLDVAANAKATDAAFEQMLARWAAGDYTMDIKRWGTGDKKKAMNENFAKFNRMLPKLPGDTAVERLSAMDRLFRQSNTVGEWTRLMEAAGIPYTPPGQTAVDAVVYGSSTLGPKIGNGFWQNLNGNFSPLTIDLWMRRTWGRLTGKSIGLDDALPGQRERLNAAVGRSRSRRNDVDAYVDELQTQLDAATTTLAALTRSDFGTKKAFDAEARRLRAEASTLREVIADAKGVKAPEPYKAAYNTDNAALLAYAKRLLKVWDTEYKRLVSQYGADAIPDDLQPTWARAAKTIRANLGTPLDQVANGTQRRQIETAGRLAIQKLAARGINVTMADMQALLWYPEKELWSSLTRKLDVDEDGVPIPITSNLNESYDAVFTRILGEQGYEVQRSTGDGAGAARDRAVFEQPDITGERDQGADGEAVRADQRGRGTGGYSSGGLTPLEGAPTVVGAAGPDPELVAVAEQYAAANGIDLRRQAEFVEVDAERATRIAQAYEEMAHAPQDPAVQAAYADLIQQTIAQYQALVDAGYTFTFFDSETDPYEGNPWNAMRDLRANKTMAVYGTYDGYGTEGLTAELIADNPMLQDTGLVWLDQNGVERPVTANDLFRAVHDAFGHGIEGAGFRARGEENAWQAHVRLFTGPAVAVLTSETRGQNSWLNYGPFGEQNRTASVEDTVFAPQKAGIMPEFTWVEGRSADEVVRPQQLEQPGPTPGQPTPTPETPQQGTVGAPRGSYRLPTTDDPRNLFTLSANADPSTFVHEVGHMFLFQMLRDLSDPRLTAEGRAQLQGQIDATRAWFSSNAAQGLTDLKALSKSMSKRAAAAPDDAELQLRASRLTAAVQRAEAGGGAAYMEQVAQSFMDPAAPGRDEAAEVVYHELWARGFEKYLGTGSAPSAELRNVFAKFAQYISNVYKSLRRLNVTVSPEIADVFDRLLATEEAIIEERRGAMYQLSPGVLEGATPAEANELRRLASEAEAQARTEMASRVENSLKAEERAKRRARREVLANEISEQVAAEPVYAATNIAKRGVLPDGTKTGTGKIDRAELIAVAGEEAVGRMPSGMVSGRVRPDNAIPLGDLATLSGFADIYSMIEALTNPTPTPETTAVKERVDAAMLQEFGSDLDAQSLQTKAVEVVQNDKFQQLQQLQLRILRRLAAQPMARIAQRQAEQEGAPAAAVDRAATEAAQAEQAAARTPREGVQASLARIRADVQRTANASQRRAQVAARRQTASIRLGMDTAAITEAAKRYVRTLKVKDATPARYRQAAARLTAKIERAIADRDYTQAATLMEQRALNLAVAKETSMIQTKIETQRTRWREVTARSDKRLAQRYSIDWVNAIRVVLEPFGMARNTPRNYDPVRALADLQAVEPTLYTEIQLAISTYAARSQAAAQANPNNPYKDLSVQEALDLLETADTMLANARDSHGILVEGRRVEFGAIADEVSVNVSKRRKVQKQAGRLGRGRGSRTFRETRRQLGAFKASLRRIEQWARDFDNGNPRGPLTRYLVRPVMTAVDAYTVARKGPQEALAALLRTRTDLMARRPIRAQELDGYVFQTKGELIMALLHTGNDSNKRKLLLGGATDVETNRRYVWGSQDADGNLDTSRWDAFVDRLFADGVLTQADMELVQGIWDIFETTKQAAQAAHKQMYGYYFTEVQADPVVTPFGIYPGGYAPAITDSMMNPDGARFEAEEVMSQQSNASMFPGAEKGFTQSRTEYNQPLDLDLTRIPAHFDRVMKFAYLGPAVRQAARLVTNRGFREAVRPGSPDVIDVAVIPWLQRTVQQRVTTPPTNQGWSGVSRVAAAIDRRVGLHIMAANLVNAAQQITGFTVAAARIPARHLAVAATRWRVNNQSARAYIIAQSPFMEDRMTGGMNEASTTLERILSEPGLLNRLQDASTRYGYFAQQIAQNLVDPTVWLAAERHGMEVVYPTAYAEALDRTGDEAAADTAARAEVVAYADSVVRDTQAPLRPSDVSGIEASSPLARLFLKFYSYFNAMGNLLVTEKNIAMNSDMGWAGRYGRSFYAYLMIVTIPTIIAESIAQLARGGFEDLEDEDERDQLMFELLIGSQLKTMAAMVPFAGSVASTVYGIAVTEQVYDDRISLSAGIGVTESTLQNLTRLIVAAADPDTDIETRRAIRTMLDALGLALGLPTNWASKPISYAVSVAEGDSRPEGFGDIFQGALTGKDGTDR